MRGSASIVTGGRVAAERRPHARSIAVPVRRHGAGGHSSISCSLLDRLTGQAQPRRELSLLLPDPMPLVTFPIVRRRPEYANDDP
jgi:hypothetical protein